MSKDAKKAKKNLKAAKTTKQSKPTKAVAKAAVKTPAKAQVKVQTKVQTKVASKQATSTVAKPGPVLAVSKNVTAALSRTLKGLDNEANSARKAHDALNSKLDKITESVSSLNRLVAGLSNASVTTVPAAKTAVKSDAKPVAKVNKPVGVKKNEVPEKDPPANVVNKSHAVAKGAGEVEVVKIDGPVPTNGSAKPPLKGVIESVLNDSTSPLSAANIYTLVTAKYGTWSRQSLYNALKDDKRFSKTGEGAEATYSVVKSQASTPAVTDDEADLLIKKMETNSAPLANMI